MRLTTARVQRFRDARRDPALVVLEGFHALKHALRFGAEVVEAIAADLDALRALAGALAPDVLERMLALVEPVAPEVVAASAPVAPPTGVLAIARRPAFSLAELLADPRPAPVVLLEDPRHLGNLGACVRVAAAADAAGLLTVAGHDPWHPDAVRGAAGLHFALPVARVQALAADGDRPLVAVDPDGDALRVADASAAGDPRLRQRAPRPERRAARARRRTGADPDARRGLEPQPRDVGGGGAVAWRLA